MKVEVRRLEAVKKVPMRTPSELDVVAIVVWVPVFAVVTRVPF
jgi:hypothetical protein